MKTVASLLVTLLTFSVTIAQPALAAARHRPHQHRPNIVSPKLLLQSFKCNRVQNDQFIGLVNEPLRLVLRVSVPQENVDFNCEDAGGIVQFDNPVPFESMAIWIKTSGDVDLCNDIDLWYWLQNQTAATGHCLTAASTGRTVAGFTEYILNADSFGVLGSPITAVGISVARSPNRSNEGYEEGVVTIGRFDFNGQSVLFSPSAPLDACPFSAPCINDGGSGSGNV